MILRLVSSSYQVFRTLNVYVISISNLNVTIIVDFSPALPSKTAAKDFRKQENY